jgi:hypothetical protein
VETSKTGTLDCLIHRFAGQPAKLTFLDADRPQTAHRKLAGTRHSFAEQFRRMLARQFPGWHAHAVTSSIDLQRSLSPLYPRARLTRGNQQIAAVACPSGEAESGLLTFALIWFDYLSRHTQNSQLCLFLPDGYGALTAQRLRWMNGSQLRARVFRFNEHGSAGEVDPQDLGNIDTRVSPQSKRTEHHFPVLADLARIEGISISPELTGQLSVRCRGTEFARIRNARFFLGLEQQVEATADEVLSFAVHMSSLPALPAAEERWLESVIRFQPERIHPSLHSGLLHSQVLTFAGTDRDMVDLLGVTRDGQLAVLELKANEDIHLPLQALDYWMHIRWHAERSELAHLFPGISLRSSPPLLFLVAPALAFHPTAQTLLRYFSPEIDVERIGVNTNWWEGMRVVLRLHGAASPQSQGNYEHHYRNHQHQEGHYDPEPGNGSSSK